MQPLLIRLTNAQRVFIRRESRATKVSEAETIRRAIEHYQKYIRG